MSNPSIFSAGQFADFQVKNRIALAPLTRGRAGSERVANDLMAEYYRQRDTAGVLISEATVVSPQGIGWIDSPGIYTQAMVEGWRQVTAAVTAPFVMQLWHCGRASHSDFHQGERPVSASAIKLNGDHIHTPQGAKPYETPRALTPAEIQATVDDYKRAAELAKQAGCDGIEVHAANGYLINQFLESKTNQRGDSYGGSIANRFRFLREILDAVLEVWSPEHVGVRVSPNGVFNDMGSPDFRETHLYVANALSHLGLGYLHVMDGLAFGFHQQGEPMTLQEFRAVFSGSIMGNCGYTQEMAEQALAQGVADMIAIGRPFIANPDLVARWQQGQPLAPYDDMSTWYTPGAEGYTDYPVYSA